MVSNWKKYQLSELASFSYGKMPKKELLNTGQYPTFSGYKYQYSYPEYNCTEGDLIVVARGVGGTGDVKLVKEKCYLTNLSIKISLDNSIVCNRFLYYRYLNTGLRHLDSGSAQSQITINDLGKEYVTLPNLAEQKEIARVLGTLDDKIELNRQMNETLESMAQALFKSWFVDFDPVIDNALLAGKAIPEPLKERAELRQAQLNSGKANTNSKINDLFPSEFEFTEDLGWIPKGWSVGEVGDIVDRLKVKKRYKKSDVMSFGKTPVFEQGSNILLGFHNKIADIQADVENPAFIFGDHTCVINLSLEPFSVSANVIPLVGKNYPTYWVYYAVHGKQSFEEYRRHWMELIIKTTILPTNDVANLYMSHIKHLKEKQMRMLHTSNTLMEIRDTLLPKLMSGELRIPDAEKLVENI